MEWCPSECRLEERSEWRPGRDDGNQAEQDGNERYGRVVRTLGFLHDDDVEQSNVLIHMLSVFMM